MKYVLQMNSLYIKHVNFNNEDITNNVSIV